MIQASPMARLSPGDATRPLRLWYTAFNVSQANYQSGIDGESPSRGTATSPPFPVYPGAVFLFDSWYDVEGRDASAYDLMTVEYARGSGAWTPLCRVNPTSAARGLPDQTTCSSGTFTGAFPCPRDESYTPLASWETRRVTVPFSSAGGVGKFRFVFDTVDGLQNEGAGWKVANPRVAPLRLPAVPPIPFPIPPINTGCWALNFSEVLLC